jgi:lipopolysaccharide/colanic/teichoic acid biosynthesis glycosyltransferase
MLHLDEMPQLLNVIKGDMSFVGPRSGQPAFEHLYTREAYERLRVHPGITGLGAVVGGRFLENDSLYAVEAAYVAQQSPALDFLIAVLTPVFAVFGTRIPRLLLAKYVKGIRLAELAGEQEQ